MSDESLKPVKTIDIKLSDGRVYQIMASKIAHDRAKHYSNPERDDVEVEADSYKEEYNYTISNEDELSDWLSNQMDWYSLDPILLRHDLDELSDCDIDSKEFHHE